MLTRISLKVGLVCVRFSRGNRIRIVHVTRDSTLENPQASVSAQLIGFESEAGTSEGIRTQVGNSGDRLRRQFPLSSRVLTLALFQIVLPLAIRAIHNAWISNGKNKWTVVRQAYGYYSYILRPSKVFEQLKVRWYSYNTVVFRPTVRSLVTSGYERNRSGACHGSLGRSNRVTFYPKKESLSKK